MADQLSALGGVIAIALDNELGTFWRRGPDTGLPAGGTAGQVLAKQSGTDYDVTWIAAPSGAGGAELETTDINAQTGTAYELALADRGQTVTMSSASANVVTIPTTAAVALDVGSVIAVLQLGSGQTTVTGASGVTVNGADGGSVAVVGQWQGLSLTKIAADTWVVSGGAS